MRLHLKTRRTFKSIFATRLQTTRTYLPVKVAHTTTAVGHVYGHVLAVAVAARVQHQEPVAGVAHQPVLPLVLRPVPEDVAVVVAPAALPRALARAREAARAIAEERVPRAAPVIAVARGQDKEVVWFL